MKVFIQGRFVGPFPTNKFEFRVEAGEGKGQFINAQGLLPITAKTAGTFLRYFQAEQRVNGKVPEVLRKTAEKYILYSVDMSRFANEVGSDRTVFAADVLGRGPIEFVWTEGPILSGLRADSCPWHELTDEDVERFLNQDEDEDEDEDEDTQYSAAVGNDSTSKSPFKIGDKVKLTEVDPGSFKEPRYRIVDAGRSYTTLFFGPSRWTATEVGIPQEAVNLYKASQRKYEDLLVQGGDNYEHVNGLVGTKVCSFKHLDDARQTLVMLTLDNGLTCIVGENGLERIV